MTTIESCRNIAPLTRFARAMARLLGVGACLGIGLSTLPLWEKYPGFVENNQLSMMKRMVLLGWFFAPTLLLPALVALIVVSRTNDPRRLFTLESVARKLMPLIILGLLPPLVHDKLWKSQSLLFLVATLVSTLIVYGSLRSTSFSLTHDGTVRVLRAIKSYLPARLSVWLPWTLLALLLIAIGIGSAEFITALPLRAPKVAPASTVGQAIRTLGNGGILAVPFMTLPSLAVGAPAHRVAQLWMIAAAALPLYAWARLRLGRAMALVVASFYLSFPPLLTVGSTTPLPLGVAAGFFFLAAWAWEKQRHGIAVVATLLMLLVHEQTAVWLVCLCVYWVAQQRAYAKVAPGLGFVLLGYFVAVGLVWLPSLGVDPYGIKCTTLWGSTPGLVPALATVVTNPARALSRWCEQRDLVFWLSVCVPFALLPLKTNAWFFWVLPFAWFGVVTTGHAPGPSLTDASISHFIVMGFVAAVSKLDHLRRIGRMNLGWATLLTWAFALVACVYQAGCLWLLP